MAMFVQCLCVALHEIPQHFAVMECHDHQHLPLGFVDAAMNLQVATQSHPAMPRPAPLPFRLHSGMRAALCRDGLQSSPTI